MLQDVIIIGGNFAGISAAMQLARAQRHVTLIDSGEPRNRFARQSHGFLGQDGVSPKQIQQDAQRQLLKYSTVTFVQGKAINAKKSAEMFSVTLDNNQEISAKKLILATGLKDEIPTIPGLRERWGTTVAHCPYCHGYEFRNRPLAVIATGPHSIHQAGLLADWGPTTYFTQGEFAPDAEQASFLEKRGVRIEASRVVEVLGRAPNITSLYLEDGRTVRIEAVFVAPKSQIVSPIADQLGCALVEAPMGQILQTDDMKQTSVAGVFTAGDIVNPMQNATFASASGVMAGVGAHFALVHE
ncbi:NAD(P)/FAD-dependent oxidoreductase [Marinomonas sp. THO17]|uniref:NAD(P)/FAD-dependent oxidoreductase n=1 Tax=Marinomonas sp. THO17 TaxID=3149048 RepID=UPI00336BE889